MSIPKSETIACNTCQKNEIKYVKINHGEMFGCEKMLKSTEMQVFGRKLANEKIRIKIRKKSKNMEQMRVPQRL